jgi:hypothetical protein
MMLRSIYMDPPVRCRCKALSLCLLVLMLRVISSVNLYKLLAELQMNVCRVCSSTNTCSEAKVSATAMNELCV